MNTNINAQQVGGTHYQTSYPHWDWVIDVGMGYLLGCATKHVSRARKKNGLQDLEKSVHYVDKFLEVVRYGDNGAEFIQDTPEEIRRVILATNRFANANDLTAQEYDFCLLLAQCQSEDDVIQARAIALALVEQASRQLPLPRPVPLTDSNKHADRAAFDTLPDDYEAPHD